MTSNAPGWGTSICSSWKASIGSPSRSCRITQAAMVSGRVPGSTPTSVTSVRSVCATRIPPSSSAGHPTGVSPGRDCNRRRRCCIVLSSRAVRGRVLLIVICPRLAGAGGTGADSSSLYPGPAPRPGPDILYEPPATAPQLTNGPGGSPPPTLVSGASAYRDGEFLYQDYLYDDHGANGGQRDQNDPRGQAAGTSSDLFSQPNGTYTYPTDGAYAMNAADLVEFRVKPLADSTAFRITLNTMKDARLYGITIAIGGRPGVELPMPDGANTTAPADMFLTIHGASGKLVDAVTKADLGAVSVNVNEERRQIEVSVPHAIWDPTGKTERLAAAAGLWDNAANKYLIPQQDADATHPGGAGNLSAPSAFFNVAFRNKEPTPAPNDPENTASPAWWRERQQGTALAAGSIGDFFANVDFAKLAAGSDDDSGVPKTGPMDRILASHFE